MSALKTDRGKANTAIPVRKEASAVRFSARSTWISPKMTLSSFGRLFVSILIVFNEIDSAQTLVENRVEPVESPHPYGQVASVAFFRIWPIVLDV
jgi:hypothetical protein